MDNSQDFFEKSMETTFKILDGFDVIGFFDTQNSTGGGNESKIHCLMNNLERALESEVAKHPELEGCLFNAVNDVEFAEYLEKRYKSRLYTREVTTIYIGRYSNTEETAAMNERLKSIEHNVESNKAASKMRCQDFHYNV